jgi:hypothetical protein
VVISAFGIVVLVLSLLQISAVFCGGCRQFSAGVPTRRDHLKIPYELYSALWRHSDLRSTGTQQNAFPHGFFRAPEPAA